MDTKPDTDVWAGDLLGRRPEADLLTAYLESIATRPRADQGACAHIIAVDAAYGVGKSFFLKRLRDHLAATHPVAFVDAWTDDLADEPLTALAATLKVALAPLIAKPDGTDAWRRVTSATGRVAKIVGMGIAKQALSALVSSSGAELLLKTVDDLSTESAKGIAQGLGELAGQAVEGGVDAFAAMPPGQLMDERIAEFEAGKKALTDLKEGLAALVEQLPVNNLGAPIVIIIDELDRCRPTYAIKLLEEIKHLFDVDGIVFVLGINLDQLARSVRGLYGETFDGTAYLKRFISRRYRLHAPTLEGLLQHLLKTAPELEQKLLVPQTRIGDRTRDLPLPAILAYYLQAYDLHARDAIQVFDRLVLCSKLTNKNPLVLPYLLPLILSEIRGEKPGDLAQPERSELGFQEEWWDEQAHRTATITMGKMAKDMAAVATLPAGEQSRLGNKDRLSLAEEHILRAVELSGSTKTPLANPRNYTQLLNAIGSFE